MVESFLLALHNVTEISNLIFIFLGSLFGLVFGALPGLGGVIALALLLPITYGMAPMPAMFLLSGSMGAVPFGGSISAILLNIPGTPQNAATIFDGYPMTQKGEGRKALGISATASALGAIFGLIVLLALIPVVRAVVLAFGPPEIFMLILLGLSTISVASRGNMIKGLVAGGVGIALSFIGFNPVTGVARYSFGSYYFWDGIQLIPFFIGIFAFSELFNLSFKGERIAETRMVRRGLSGVLEGAKVVFSKKICFFRSAAIGTMVGIVPGVGGAVANFLSYTIAMQTAKNPETFGKGNPEGVLAAEAANNAKEGGALLPTVAFGIPGSAEMALLLGAFILHGLTPGPLFIKEHLDLVFALILGVLISNLIASSVGILLADVLARVTTIKVSYIIPIVGAICLAGAYGARENIWDVLLAVVCGFLGLGMVKFGYPLVTLAIGYVLGEIAELNFHYSVEMAYGRYTVFFTRPIALALFILTGFMLIIPFIKNIRGRDS